MLEHERLTEQIIGAAIEVQRSLGPGFLESVYAAAMAIELRRLDIPFERERTVQVLYRGELVGTHRLDLFVAGEVVVELKAVTSIQAVHFSVVRSYLRAVGRQHGLIINFAVMPLVTKRVIYA